MFLANVEKKFPVLVSKDFGEDNPLEVLVAATAEKLRLYFGSTTTVDPLPKAVTLKNLDKWAALNLQPVFLPGVEISESRDFSNWVKLRRWFYDEMHTYDTERKLGLPPNSARLKRGWYLADFTIAADYANGEQIFVNDPLSPLITKLREAKVIGNCVQPPSGSRFAITHNEWQNKVLLALSNEFWRTGAFFRLERAIEFNAIGNVYDTNRGKFDCWEWFGDTFQSGSPLVGGGRVSGGMSAIGCGSAFARRDGIAGRPLGYFV